MGADRSRPRLAGFALNRDDGLTLALLERGRQLDGPGDPLRIPDLDVSRERGLAWESCAVVGNAASLRKGRRGAEIDGHSAVIRFNRAPTRGHERQVGAKTTLRFTNPEREGTLRTGGPFCEGRELVLTKGLKSLRKPTACRVLPLSPQFVAYGKYLWGLHPRRRAGAALRSKMSTGFYGLAFALHVCKRVTVYGFRSNGSHYYRTPRTLGIQSWRARHQWDTERACLQRLAELPNVDHVS